MPWYLLFYILEEGVARISKVVFGKDLDFLQTNKVTLAILYLLGIIMIAIILKNY